MKLCYMLDTQGTSRHQHMVLVEDVGKDMAGMVSWLMHNGMVYYWTADALSDNATFEFTSFEDALWFMMAWC